MADPRIMFLTADERQMWAEAGAVFPGEKFQQVLSRTLKDLPATREINSVYELRRGDIPSVFDGLLKLQATGAANMYIEAEGDDFREVLTVEVALMDAIMRVFALILDSILNFGDKRERDIKVTPEDGLSIRVPVKKGEYVAFKRRRALIEHDGLKF